MAEPVLYGAGYSAYTRIARLALLEKGVSYRFETVDVFAPGGPPDTYLLRHPFGRIPAFEHGNVALYEACAISRYVDEMFAGPSLQPVGAAGRAQVTQIVSVLDAYAFRPMVMDIYVERVTAPKRGRAPDEARIGAAMPQATRCLSALARLMGDAPWLAGAALTLADLHAAPMFAYFCQAAEAVALLADHPSIRDWWQRMATRELVVATRFAGEVAIFDPTGGSMRIDWLVPITMAAMISGAVPAHAESPLPAGPGRQIVETYCTACHDIDRVTGAGYTRDGWRNTISMMVNTGAPLTTEQFATVTDYLARNFPEKPKPAAVVIAGNAHVTIKEWVVPTPGSRPHDPLAAPDGAIWYSGHMANLLGRLDPKTGQFKEFHPTTPQSGPHGLVFDKDGKIWFTANFQGYIGRLDPATGTFTEFPLPDPDARDPHTPLFDQKGTLWFTVQSADMVGRLRPDSGEIKLARVPTPRANPYGMVITSAGVPWFAEFGSNKLASIDPDTMAIREYVLPNAGARPRRVAITGDDIIWYSDYARGYLGRFDPKTGKVTEWASPGGPGSQPYGIAILKGAVWYSESGIRPNTLVRFDPATEKFQTWIIPSGGGVVRNMMTTKDGNLVMACSGVNRVALVEVQ